MRLRHAIVGLGIVLALRDLSPSRDVAAQGFTDASTTSAEPKGPAENKPALHARSLELDIPAGSYFAGPESRGLLIYMVRCALHATTEAQLALPGEKLTFTGGLGLAPEWAQRALTLTEQRWVFF